VGTSTGETASHFLRGRYIFGDFTGKSGTPDGRIFVASPPEHDGGKWVMSELMVAGRKGGQAGRVPSLLRAGPR
jgi:hypothetical protein